jgi:hypothetical protein
LLRLATKLRRLPWFELSSLPRGSRGCDARLATVLLKHQTIAALHALQCPANGEPLRRLRLKIRADHHVAPRFIDAAHPHQAQGAKIIEQRVVPFERKRLRQVRFSFARTAGEVGIDALTIQAVQVARLLGIKRRGRHGRAAYGYDDAEITSKNGHHAALVLS